MTYRIRNVAIAIGLALVAMLLTLFYVINYRRSVQHGQATVRVYVAARNIVAGTAGTDIAHGKSLRAVSVPRRSVVPGAISDPNQVASLVLTQPLYAGEQVTLRRFSDLHAEGIVGQLKHAMRAVQVPGDQYQLLAGTLRAGDHVDVVANIGLKNDSANDHVTRIVLRDLTVLQAPSENLAANATNQQTSAILAVSDIQVQRLWYVLKNADWTLELRPAVDATDNAERLENTQSVIAAGGARLPITPQATGGVR
jgi:Flp pilus assembly protein CpaB